MKAQLIRTLGFPAPVLGDVTEQPMLDLVPLAGPRREVTDAYAEVALIGELLEFQFPGPCPVAVAASGVGGDEQGRRVRVGSPTHPLPPLANRRDGEGGRIVVAPHAHPRLVSGHIVDAVRDGLPTGIRREIVDEHRFRLARWLPFPPSVLELANQFLLLRVDRNHRLPAPHGTGLPSH